MNTIKMQNGVILSSVTLQGSRMEQQDYRISYQLPDRTIAIVCDGMGGLEGGSIASRHAAKLLLADLEKVSPYANMYEFFKYELEKLDDAVFGLRKKDGSRMGAGTTVVATLMFGNRLYWFSVGDSKLYYVRGNEMHCVTREHNYALQLENEPESHLTEEEKKQLKREKGEQLISYLGMGTAELFDSNYSAFEMQPGDKILLCTDGVYRTLSELEIKRILFRRESAEKLCSQIEQAIVGKEKRNQDNATWIVLQKMGEA